MMVAIVASGGCHRGGGLEMAMGGMVKWSVVIVAAGQRLGGGGGESGGRIVAVVVE